MAYQEFDGELDGEPGYLEFTGTLDAPPSRTRGEAAMDGARSFGASVNNTLKTLTDLAGTNNSVSGFLDENAKTWQEKYSPSYKAELQKQSDEKAALGDDPSYAARAGLMAKQVIRNPIEGIGELAGNIAPMAVGGLAGLGAKGITALSAAMGAGAVKGGIAETIQNAPEQSLMADPLYAQMRGDGVPEQEAKAKLGERRASYGDAYGKILLGAGIGAAVGKFGSVENAIANMGKGVAGPGFLKSIGKEVVTEIPQEMTETYLGNKGAASQGANIAADQGVVEAGVKAGILSAVGGGVAGLSGRSEQQPQIDKTPPAPATPEQAVAAITSPEVTTVDQAIAASVAAMASPTNYVATPVGTIGTSTPGAAGPGFNASNILNQSAQPAQVIDESDLSSLVQSEQRNLQVMRAQMEQERTKQAELDQIQPIAAEQDVTQAAVERATELETPTAMESAFSKLFDKTLAPEPETALTPPKPAPEPRIVERAPDMVAMPRELAELRVAMNGGEVVRVRNQSGKFAFTVLTDDAKPSLSRVANAAPPANPGGVEMGAVAENTKSVADNAAFESKIAGFDTQTPPTVSQDSREDRIAIEREKLEKMRRPPTPIEQTKTPAPAGVSVSAFETEKRPDGTLIVKGDAAAIREALKDIPAKSLIALKSGILVGRSQAEKAMSALKPAELTQAPAQAEVAPVSGEAQQVQSSPLGRNNVPLAEGGKPYKTKMGADVARKNQPMMRTKRVEGGFVLVEKTPAQLAAQEKAAKRLSQPRTSPNGEPIPAHSMIASAGGLSQSERSDMGIGDNPKVGNRRLFAGTGGLTIEQATEKLVEDGYLQEGASHSQAMDLIKRSLTNPQYTPEGTERMVQKALQEREAAFQAEQETVAEIESATDNEIDQIDDADIPWDAPVSNASLEDAMAAMGFSEQEIQDAIANESAGPSEDSQSGQQVNEGAATQAQGDIRSGEGAQGQDQGSREGLTLSAPTRQEVIAQQDAVEAEAKRKEEGGDKLIQKKVTGDTPDMFNTQGSVFDVPAEPTQPVPQSKPTEPAAQATETLDAANITGQERVTAMIAVNRGDLTPEQLAAAYPAKIDDVGEKIGGARKDTAASTGPKRKTAAEEDERPTWAKRFQIAQVARGFDMSVNGRDITGKWTISDTRTKDRFDQPKRMGDYFDTKEAAEAALPLIAVAQKHRVAPTGQKNADGGYTYEIWRDVNDRKRVKVVDQVFDSREEAMRYMAQYATEILETNTTFGEADLPKPENTSREGVERRTGDVKGEDFRDAFGFRGVEFGLWNNQDERQEVMNAAYDGLMDLAEVLKVPPKAIGLNGDLALAFGARGKGLSGARAHYERDRVVMNLTKMNGAGALAHEWFHGLDHYLARQDGKTTADWKINKDGTRSLEVLGGEADMASGGFRRSNSGVREELRTAYTSLVQSLFTKAEQYVEDTARADKFVAVARGELQKDLDDLRKDLADQKDVRYYKRNNKPASAEQLAEFDAMAAELVDGRGLATEWKTMPGRNRLSIQTRHTNETLEKLNSLYTAVRGRSGFNTERRGVLDALSGYMKRYDQRMQMLREATALTSKTKRVPTSFAMDAKSLDQGRGGDYWTSPHEMVARAFQGYVEDAIAANEGRSPFLNYAPENVGIITPWGAKRPYPAGDERKAMNAEFVRFIDVLETRETDQGVAMFARGAQTQADALRRSSPARPGMSIAAVQQAVDKLAATWTDGPPINVVATPADLPVAGAPSDVRGMVHKGTVYVVAANHRDVRGVAKTLAHEAVGHYGLWKMLGTDGTRQFSRNLQLALKSGNVPLKKIAAQVRALYVDENGDFNLTPAQESNEVAAFAVEDAIDADGNFKPGLGFLKSVFAKVVAFLRSKGFTIEFTNAELQGMLVNAMRGLEAGKRLDGGGQSMVVAARSNTPMEIREAIIGNTLGSASQHPDYAAAKAGDVEAAVRVADSLVTDALVEKVGLAIGSEKPLVVPVVSVEATGNNKIPLAAAATLARKLGLNANTSITQVTSPKRTSMDGLDRIFASPEFDGEVIPGQTYLLVDDTLTQGATFAALESHILAGGGRVVGAVALTGKQYSATLQPSAESLRQLRDKFGDIENDFRAATGYGFDALTQSEVRYLTNFQPVDTLRAEILARGNAARLADDQQDSGRSPALARPDSGDALARGGVATGPNQTSNTPPEETTLQAQQRTIQDKFNRFKVLQEWVKEQGVDLSEAADVYLAETLMSGRISSRKEDFRERQMGPLIKKTQAAGFSLEQVVEFLKAQHAPEANKRAREIHANPDATAFGVTDKDAQSTLDEFKALPDFAKFKDVANEWRSITEQTRNILLDGGILSKEMVAAWESTYSFYVPVKGAQESSGTGKGLSVNGKTKRRLGHELRDEAIIENILRDHERAISLDEKNLVGQALIRFALEAKNDEIITVGSPIKRQVLKPGQTHYMVTHLGTDVAIFESQSEAKQFITGEVALKHGSKADFQIDDTTDPARVMLQVSPMLADNEVTVYVGGSAVRVQINDEIAARAYTNLGVEHLNTILSAAREFNSWLSKAYTGYSPDFIFTNPLRDATQGFITLTGEHGAGMAKKIFAQYPHAVKELIKHFRNPGSSKLVTEYRASGGSTGGAYLSDLERIGNDLQAAYNEHAGAIDTYNRTYAKAISEGRKEATARTLAALKAGAAGIKHTPAIGHFLRFMERVNAITENALRVATYDTLTQNGVSRARAAAQAKNLMNFNRKGEVSNQAGALYLFFNPNVQGSQVMYRALMDSPHKKEARVLGGMMVLAAITLAEMALSGGGDDAEKWKNTPAYLKDGNWILGFGDYQTTLTLPYGYRIFHTLGNVMSDFAHGADGNKLGIRLASAVFSNFSPVGNPMEGDLPGFQLLPTLPKMLLGPSVNEDSFGREIGPKRWNDANPDSQMMHRATKGSIYSGVAEGMNALTGGSKYQKGLADVSPETLKYWVRSLTGGAGQAAFDLVSIGNVMAQDVSPATRDIPIVRRFVREIGVGDARGAFWERAKEAKEAADEFAAAKKANDVQGMRDILKESGPLIALAKFASAQQKVIKAKRDAIDAIRLDDKLTLKQKHERMKIIEMQETAVYTRFVKTFDSKTK
jgi:adenine/guanine phosphoribosyltransferase-like PRPP-binding protein